MEVQEYLIILASFLIAAGVGFAVNQKIQDNRNQQFSEDVSLKVNSSDQIKSIEFDGHFIELRYEDTTKAKFYYKFNDTRDVQQIKGLQQDGTLQTFRDIKSFDNQTYFLYLRYVDDPNQSEDGFMELYRIEET